MKIVDVAVGVIKRQDMIYVSKRADTLHQGGLWEFPGGKKEADETIAQALIRELFEEVNIQVLNPIPLMVIEHDYGDKKVRLDVMLVEEFSGEPSSQENQLSRWVKIADLAQYDFPAANLSIIEKLQQLAS
ncbi:8-oxo-dGTP diphosphatase MutT [Paraglaciecola hydrolytica]|uniref:8-oxo-dGTP diphosphatase n=1 Tax=Paraglaciecola hydrolytica TaxID=1799789 RepID=A0A136A6Q4_9ALTE|nr:8-oxo-dGTP diphosphatase MutT [Paraglaciecola hydrolytica]KXI30918.1 7,8-dihydro-8-oxoguanine-triphosphatase [Paraglaciecola hydrolytica]